MISRRKILKALALGSVAQAGVSLAARAQSARVNVLLVVMDDLNCCISPYSPAQGVHSPNFERLRSWGAMFENAYAAVPACSPSRTAMLLGMDPMRTGIFTNDQSWRDAKTPADAASLFGHFRAHGWYVGGTGKLFHRSNLDLRASDWDEYWLHPNHAAWNSDLATDIAISAHRRFDFGPSEVAGRADMASTDWLLDRLKAGAFDGGGALLALGLNRPHQPHSVPKEWFDHYPEQVALPPGYWPGATDLDGNLPDQQDLGPMARGRIPRDLGDRLMRNDELNAFLRAYYASVTFADAQLGRVLDALEAQGLRDSTYVVTFSDNGYMLGEKRDFTKFELREVALRVPLFICGPGIVPQVVKTPVSLVDLYPTLCGLAGVQVPPQCDGLNLAPPLLSGQPPAREPVLSYNGRFNRKSGRLWLHSSVRTSEWRLINHGWPVRRPPIPVALREEIELYNHDPDSPDYDPHEWTNVASKRPDVVTALRKYLPATVRLDLVAPETTVVSSGEQ